MEWFEQILRYSHIIFGFLGLIVYWFPIFSRKGGKTHVRFGKLFVSFAYIVVGSAVISVVYHIGKLALAGLGPVDRPDTYAFLLFLGYLAYITFVVVRYSVDVLRSKRNPGAIATPVNLALSYGAIGASLVLLGYTLYFAPPSQLVLFALSPIGLLSGMSNLNYMRGKQTSPRAWLYEHLGSTLGAGIAFHTAFLVFGISRLVSFGLEGWMEIIPWVLPTIIGTPATIFWTRHLKKKFGELPGNLAKV